MARFVKLLTPLATVVVLFAVDEYHARFVGHYQLTAEPRFGWLMTLLALVLIASYVTGVNETDIPAGSRLTRAAVALLAAVAVIGLAYVIVRRSLLPLFDLGASVGLLVPILTVVAAIADRSVVHQGQQERVIALVGEEDRERLMRDMNGNPERPSQIVLAVDPPSVLPTDGDDAPLGRIINEYKATLIVLSREAQGLDGILTQAVSAHSRGVRIRTLSLFYDEWLGKLPISELERIALLFDINEIHRPVYARVKRLLDVVVAALGSILLAAVIPLVAAVDLAGNRGPLFYRQPRVGKNGAVFTILKFRTMRPHDAPTAWTTENDPRIGGVGRGLRKLHIDELPQVWNVLKRDMSIVGPRPEQPHYVEQLSESIPFYDVRHLVRPGITGWAQVKYDYGASEIDALEKLQYDFFYLRHQDLTLDLRVMGRTLRSMFRGEGR